MSHRKNSNLLFSKYINVIKIYIIPVLLFSFIFSIGCGSGIELDQYVSPTYKTTDKVLGIVKFSDERPSGQKKEVKNTDRITKSMIEVSNSSAVFKSVRFSDEQDTACNLMLSGKVKNYKVDENMTTGTWLKSAIIFGALATVGIILEVASDSKQSLLPYFLISGAIAGGLDFLIWGLGGKRNYDHHYSIQIDYEVKEVESNKTICSGVSDYKLTLRFTHRDMEKTGWGTKITEIDANEVADYALTYVSQVAAEKIIDDIAQRIGSKKLMGMNDDIKMYPLENHHKIGSVEFDILVEKQ